MKKFTTVLVIISIISSYLLFQRSVVYGLNIIEKDAQISAYIGNGRFSVYGYAPSNSQVILSGIGIYDEQIASKNGYFEFKNQFLPINPAYEPCLTAKDKFGRITNPVCIPPIPKDYEIEIGPVLLPPTISLNQPNYFIGDDITFSGQSIPNSEVNLSMFVDKKSFGFIPETHAYSIPEVKGTTDDKGNYSITMPSSRVENYRVFSQLKMNQDFSPNSNIVRIKVLPYWMYIIIFLKYLFEAFKQRLLEIIILSQVIAIGIFITRWKLHPHKIMIQRAIVLRSKSPITLIKNQ